MRYVAFPSFQSKDEIRPNLHEFIGESDVTIIAGPTQSGLYLVEGSDSAIDILEFMAYPYYVFMPDFDAPVIH